jgi:uncharacterized protein YjbI with pentapeptide repeats
LRPDARSRKCHGSSLSAAGLSGLALSGLALSAAGLSGLALSGLALSGPALSGLALSGPAPSAGHSCGVPARHAVSTSSGLAGR